ncbi:hypothetical protein DFJ73DRAFT_927106 [Zopfochytrium polystomum]|nr:hypothetical protein DFJ73DRAFT_927106 [Zopfochytrium polystomum]
MDSTSRDSAGEKRPRDHHDDVDNDDDDDGDCNGDGDGRKDAPVKDQEERWPQEAATLVPTEVGAAANAVSRLYVGNLDPTVTEFQLGKTFGKFGQVAKIDFLWHGPGPRHGEPRGYCFIEFATAEAAARARTEMAGKPLCGRRLVVDYPHSLPPEVTTTKKLKFMPASSFHHHHHHHRGGGGPPGDDANAENVVNSKLQPRRSHESTESRIAALERKLKELEEGPAASPSPSTGATAHGRHQRPASSSSLLSSGTGQRGRGGGGGTRGGFRGGGAWAGGRGGRGGGVKRVPQRK